MPAPARFDCLNSSCSPTTVTHQWTVGQYETEEKKKNTKEAEQKKEETKETVDCSNLDEVTSLHGGLSGRK